MYHFKQKKFYNADLLKLKENIICRNEITKYLTDFQFEAIRFLFKNFQNHQSCILNDESGLGKTATVCTFLDTVLPVDQNKRILILVKNDSRISNWKFHLSMFVRKDFSKGISIKEWDSLRDSSFINLEYDCIIIDDRDDLISNKICLAYLLRNFEEKISLIISSKDVTTNLKLFHSTLRLIDRLDESFANFKSFEEKFSLPDLEGNPGDLNVLEKYFLRREKLIALCRDFRLRRLCEQYENELPLVDKKVYEYNLEKWKNEQKYNNTTNFFTTVYKYSSSTISKRVLHNCDIFSDVEEDEFNAEVSKLTTLAEHNNENELLSMSPLLFESDSEEINVKHNKTKAASQEKTDIKNKPNLVEKHKKTEAKKEMMTLRNKKPTVNKIQKKENPNTTNLQIKTRGMEIVTRSQAKKNKYLLLDMDKTIQRGDKVNEITKKKKLNDQKDSNVKTNRGNKKVKEAKANNSNGNKIKVNKNELPGIISNDPHYNLDVVYPTCSDVVVVTPPDEDTIIISGSSTSSDLVIGHINKHNIALNNLHKKSPELFSSFEEYNITCAQKPVLNKLTKSSEFDASKSFKRNKITNYLTQELFTKTMLTEYPKTPKKDVVDKSKKSKSSPLFKNKSPTKTTSNSTLTKWFTKSNNRKELEEVFAKC